MEKKLLVGTISVLLFLIVLVSAAIYTEPWNQNQRGGNYNLTEMNWISAENLNGTSIIGDTIIVSNLTGALNWTYLWNYPTACPGSSAVTTIGDSVTCSDLWIDSAGDNVTGSLDFNLNNITNLSRIGIGTINPQKLLHINASNGISSQAMFGPGIVSVNLAVPGITIGASSGNTAIVMGIDGDNYVTMSWEDSTTDYFKIDTNAANRDVVLQTSGGNVGIGTSSPQNLLNVAGDINATGNFSVGQKITFAFGEIIDNIVNGIIKITGSLWVNGGLNQTSGNATIDMVYGEMWNYTTNATAWTYLIPSAGVYYNMTNLDLGSLQSITRTDVGNATGGTYLTIQIPGVYKVDSAISFEGTASGRLYSWGIAKNFNISSSRNCYARRWVSNLAVVGSTTISCLLDLDTGDTVNLQVEAETTSGNIEVHAINVNAMRIGN